jgi:hypothetical protein
VSLVVAQHFARVGHGPLYCRYTVQTNGSVRGAAAHEVEQIAVAMVDHGRTSTGAPGHVALSLAFFVVRLVRSCFARPMWC